MLMLLECGRPRRENGTGVSKQVKVMLLEEGFGGEVMGLAFPKVNIPTTK